MVHHNIVTSSHLRERKSLCVIPSTEKTSPHFLLLSLWRALRHLRIWIQLLWFGSWFTTLCFWQYCNGACEPFLLHLFSTQHMFKSMWWRVYMTSKGTACLQQEGQEDELHSDICAFGGVASSRGKVWFHGILKPVSSVKTYLTSVETKSRKAVVI